MLNFLNTNSITKVFSKSIDIIPAELVRGIALKFDEFLKG